MTCAETARRLTAYLGGEFDGTTASAVRGHLRVCSTCRTCAEDHAMIRDTLAGLERAEPTAAIWDGVLAKLGEAEIADGRRSRWARLFDRVRPHLVPAGVAIGACAVAAVVIQIRQIRQVRPVAPMAEIRAVAGPPITPVTQPVPIRLAARDATTELADETARIDQRYRQVTIDLLEQARSNLGSDNRARRHFEREVAVLERAVLAAADGKPRDRSWHALVMFLERATLGDRIAAVHP